MFCDTHCHLFKEYYDDIEEVLNKSNIDGVDKFVVSGCDHKSNQEVMDVIKKDNVYGVVGLHPEVASTYKVEEIDYIKKCIKNEKIVGIGEIGLDYHYEGFDKEKQKELFKRQLEIAESLNVPVVIHSRDAVQDTIDILKDYKVRGVIHSFSGSKEVADIYVKMGFKLGIGGVVTFKNCNLINTLKEIGINDIVLETDSPYLTPVPFRGSVNFPGRVYTIAEFISNNLNVSMEEIKEITNKNVKEVFDI